MPSSGRSNGNWGEKIRLPVFYIKQLLGIAMGVDHKKLGWHRLITSPGPFCENYQKHLDFEGVNQP